MDHLLWVWHYLAFCLLPSYNDMDTSVLSGARDSWFGITKAVNPIAKDLSIDRTMIP